MILVCLRCILYQRTHHYGISLMQPLHNRIQIKATSSQIGCLGTTYWQLVVKELHRPGIKVMSDKCSGIPFHWLFYCLFKGLIRPTTTKTFNTLRPRQNGHRFTDNTFKCIVLNENVIISIEISLKFALKGPMNNTSALVQIMAWCRPGDKPLPEPMMVSLLTHKCITQPRWVKALHYCPLVWGTHW